MLILPGEGDARFAVMELTDISLFVIELFLNFSSVIELFEIMVESGRLTRVGVVIR